MSFQLDGLHLFAVFFSVHDADVYCRKLASECPKRRSSSASCLCQWFDLYLFACRCMRYYNLFPNHRSGVAALLSNNVRLKVSLISCTNERGARYVDKPVPSHVEVPKSCQTIRTLEMDERYAAGSSPTLKRLSRSDQKKKVMAASDGSDALAV